MRHHQTERSRNGGLVCHRLSRYLPCKCLPRSRVMPSRPISPRTRFTRRSRTVLLTGLPRLLSYKLSSDARFRRITMIIILFSADLHQYFRQGGWTAAASAQARHADLRGRDALPEARRRRAHLPVQEAPRSRRVLMVTSSSNGSTWTGWMLVEDLSGPGALSLRSSLSSLFTRPKCTRALAGSCAQLSSPSHPLDEPWRV